MHAHCNQVKMAEVSVETFFANFKTPFLEFFGV